MEIKADTFRMFSRDLSSVPNDSWGLPGGKFGEMCGFKCEDPSEPEGFKSPQNSLFELLK